MSDTVKTLKDKISNWVGAIVAIGTVIATALDGIPETSEWYVWVGAALFAVFGWLTGKSGDLKSSAK